jgi:hypothetical protein
MLLDFQYAKPSLDRDLSSQTLP